MLGADDVLVGMISLEDLTALAEEPQLQAGLINAADLMRPPIVLREGDSLRVAYDRLMSTGSASWR